MEHHEEGEETFSNKNTFPSSDKDDDVEDEYNEYDGSDHASDTDTKPHIEKEEEQPVDKRAEARRDFEEALARIKSGRGAGRRKRQADGGNNHDTADVTLDDDAVDLHARMMRAVDQDNEAVQQGRPALKKWTMLAEVTRKINTPHLQEFLLDNRILEAIRRWLEPLPNGTLPSVDLRVAMLEGLEALSPLIDTQLLRESRVGRIVMFFSIRPGEYPPIRRLASSLVTAWSRPIVGQSADFRASRQDDFVVSELLKNRSGDGDPDDTPQKSSAMAKLTQHLANRRRRK